MTKSTNKKNHKLTITAGITLPVVLFFVYYYNIGPRPDLEKYNLKEQLPKPQNEVAVNDRDIVKRIQHQQKVAADFNRMYGELKGWKKITWPSQPLDSANIYPDLLFSPENPTMRDYHRYIERYEKYLYHMALRRCETKYANYKGKQK